MARMNMNSGRIVYIFAIILICLPLSLLLQSCTEKHDPTIRTGTISASTSQPTNNLNNSIGDTITKIDDMYDVRLNRLVAYIAIFMGILGVVYAAVLIINRIDARNLYTLEKKLGDIEKRISEKEEKIENVAQSVSNTLKKVEKISLEISADREIANMMFANTTFAFTLHLEKHFDDKYNTKQQADKQQNTENGHEDKFVFFPNYLASLEFATNVTLSEKYWGERGILDAVALFILDNRNRALKEVMRTHSYHLCHKISKKLYEAYATQASEGVCYKEKADIVRNFCDEVVSKSPKLSG